MVGQDSTIPLLSGESFNTHLSDPHEFYIPSPKQSSIQSPTRLGDAPFNRPLCKSNHYLFSFPSIVNASATYSDPQKLFKINLRTGFLIVNHSLTVEI